MLEEKRSLLAAGDLFHRILTIDPANCTALDGLSRIRMDPSAALLDASVATAVNATNDVAKRVLKLWQKEDAATSAAHKFVNLVRRPAEDVHARPGDCWGCDSLAGCISRRRRGHSPELARVS